jgi:hypothetical protein
LRYHDPNNWPLLREALKAMGRADLIGNGKQHLIPSWQPLGDGGYQSPRRANSTSGSASAKGTQPKGKSGSALGLKKPGQVPRKGILLTQHTGLPPRKKS